MTFTLFILQHLQNKFYSEYKSPTTLPSTYPPTHPPTPQTKLQKQINLKQFQG